MLSRADSSTGGSCALMVIFESIFEREICLCKFIGWISVSIHKQNQTEEKLVFENIAISVISILRPDFTEEI